MSATSDIIFYKDVDKKFNANGIKTNFCMIRPFKKKPKHIETIVIDSPVKSLTFDAPCAYRIFVKNQNIQFKNKKEPA